MKLRVPYWATEGFDIKLNGKSIVKTYQPSSYVEIPARQWTEKDVVEVVMPFTKHLDFGPDKMTTAPANKKDGKTEYAPMWAGTFMYGPLVMAATGIKSWDEATLDVAPDLSNITTTPISDYLQNKNVTAVANSSKATGRCDSGNLFTLHSTLSFIPDYDGNKHLTHYFRINIPTDPSIASKSVSDGFAVDKSELRELLLIAKSRSEEQQVWNALTVKVPEYAPWAAHGFVRMEQQYAEAQPFMDAPANRYTQEEIDHVASALNAVINTMRPGNLPELEDLEELQQLLEKAKLLPDDDEKANRAISYAGMVIRYVSDGSGTMDMIQRATNQLKEVLKK
jgi:hypothetical protein